MAMSVRLDPTLETRVEQESRRLGITKSEFVKDALEWSLRCIGERIVGKWTSTHYDLALRCRGLVSTGNTPAF